MKTILILFVLFPFSFLQTMDAQNKGDLQASHKPGIINKIDTLYYYGADFSHVRVSDGPKTSRSLEYSKVYPSAWIAYLEKEMVNNGYVQRVLKKRDSAISRMKFMPSPSKWFLILLLDKHILSHWIQ